ncbi:MAG TPA: hypothetical protein VF580_08940, partial [Thermoanaerobaculia bacterium]
MRRALVFAVFALLALLVFGAPAAGETPARVAWDAKALWDAWPSARVSPADPWTLKHAGLREALGALEKRAPGLFRVEQEGVSSEGRKIPLLALGNGPTSVLLWSQMHGDEPTATSALLDVLSWRNAQEIDINRDALHLATPEGRFLKSVRDRYAPMIGFNLHNQGPLVAAGRSGDQAAISLLSVPFDEALS